MGFFSKEKQEARHANHIQLFKTDLLRQLGKRETISRPMIERLQQERCIGSDDLAQILDELGLVQDCSGVRKGTADYSPSSGDISSPKIVYVSEIPVPRPPNYGMRDSDGVPYALDEDA